MQPPTFIYAVSLSLACLTIETEISSHNEMKKALSEKINVLTTSLEDERALNASYKTRETQLRQQLSDLTEEKAKLEEEIAKLKSLK